MSIAFRSDSVSRTEVGKTLDRPTSQKEIRSPDIGIPIFGNRLPQTGTRLTTATHSSPIIRLISPRSASRCGEIHNDCDFWCFWSPWCYVTCIPCVDARHLDADVGAILRGLDQLVVDGVERDRVRAVHDAPVHLTTMLAE
eukprot:gene74-biopygen246